MIDFDFDDLDYTALGAGILGAFFLGFFLLSDPGNMGMDVIPIIYRIVSVVLCVPLVYVMWVRMVG